MRIWLWPEANRMRWTTPNGWTYLWRQWRMSRSWIPIMNETNSRGRIAPYMPIGFFKSVMISWITFVLFFGDVRSSFFLPLWVRFDWIAYLTESFSFIFCFTCDLRSRRYRKFGHSHLGVTLEMCSSSCLKAPEMFCKYIERVERWNVTLVCTFMSKFDFLLPAKDDECHMLDQINGQIPEKSSINIRES